MSYVLSTPTGYYTFLEFIESIGSEMVKVLSIISIMIENEYVTFNVQREGWYFDRESEDTTIDGFGWTPGSNYLHPYISWLERSADSSVYDKNCPSLPDVTNDQGFGCNANLDPSFVENDWQLSTSDYRFILQPLVTYTMTNSDGSLYDSGTFYVTEDTTMSLTMNSLMTSCFNELNSRYAEVASSIAIANASLIHKNSN